MALLAGTHYDPGTAVNAVTTSRIAQTALDTTNLRLTFTVPSNGAVLVRLRGVLHGATTQPQIFLGCLEGATIRGRVGPVGSVKGGALLATSQVAVEALYVVPGLTPGASLTWDAAYGVDILAASTGLKYGGPDNATTDDAFGGFVFEIYDTPNLLGAALYDPAAQVAKSGGSLLAMTALDTTNLRLTFTVPSTGRVLVRLRGQVAGGTTAPAILLGVLEGSAVKFRQSPNGANINTVGVSNRSAQEASGIVTGLTPGASLTWDAAYGVEVTGTANHDLKYGGPDDTTTNNAAGAFQFEIWAV